MNVEEVYNTWLETTNSKSTKTSYESNAREFFKVMFDKDISEVNDDDMKKLLPANVKKNYLGYFINKGLKQSTIKYKVKIVTMLLEQLNINRVFDDINMDAIINTSFKSTSKTLKNDTEHFNKASIQDIEEFKDWLVNDRFKDNQFKGLHYSMLVDFMITTGSRIAESFKVTWEDVVYESDSKGFSSWVIYVTGKGNKVSKNPVTDEFYNHLKENLYNGNDKEELFHGVSQQNFSRLMNDFSKERPEARKITPHSLRRYTATKLYSQTKDLVLTQRFMNHESVDTTITYLDDSDEIEKQGSYILSGKQATIDDLQDLSKEELLKLIESRPDTLSSLYIAAKNEKMLK